MQSPQTTSMPALDPTLEPRPDCTTRSAEPETLLPSEKNHSEPPKKEKPISTKKPHHHQTVLMVEERDTCPPPAGEVSSGRERLKRHRVEVAGRVWIPDMWGQEGFLKDWIDCGAFDASLVNSSIMSARDSLVEEGRRTSATRLRIQNGC